MTTELPYKAEYAKSGRASCKGCKLPIAQDSLRLAIMVQSPFFDGKMPNWHHFACFFKKQRPKSHSDIEFFDSIRWEDQQKIKEKISGKGSGDGKESSSVASKTNGIASNCKEFNIAYAKSKKSVCKKCGEAIAKGEVRISKLVQDARFGMIDAWRHVDCFVKERGELEFYASVADVPGFKVLEKDDQLELKKKIPALKRKAEDDVGPDPKKIKEEDKNKVLLKKQSQALWKMNDKAEKELSKAELTLLLTANGYTIPAGVSRILRLVSDMLTFGPLERCSECSGQISFDNSTYRCRGDLTEWTKCQFSTVDPKRSRKLEVPDELDHVKFLVNHKFPLKTRIIPNETANSASKGPVSSQSEEVKAESGKPLIGYTAAMGNKIKISKAKFKILVKNLGGEVTTKVDPLTTIFIVSYEEFNKKSKKVIDAEKYEVTVLSDAFLDDVVAVEAGGVAELIVKHNLASWGGDVTRKIKSGYKKSKELHESLFKSKESRLKLTIKGGAAVDPDSDLEDKGHVLQGSDGSLYTAVLGMVDMVRNTNSYYKLQLIAKDNLKSYYVFRSWGRVGTTIGGNKLERHSSKNEAISDFKTIYEDKTGNAWHDRNNFQKVPNKFFPIDVDYSTDDKELAKLDTSGSISKLDKPLQDIVRMIFDIESMNKALVEHEIDLKKMPLGKLSKKHIQSAFKVLTELQDLFDTKEKNASYGARVLDASTRFYTLIPHDFGLQQMPLLDTQEVIKTKTEMLDNLLEIEVAYTLLKGVDVETGEDPLDAHYKKLNCSLNLLDKNTDEFEMISKYLMNTHGATHNQYSLDLVDVFCVDREGESSRYKPFTALKNRQLLWHGSRVTNYAGILSQGLRIAPPEAPVTGYMFGKGIYFADCVSKSANYCHASSSSDTGLLLLCEVALGNMWEQTAAHNVTKLPKGKQSVIGLGSSRPDQKSDIVLPDGVTVPLGKPVQSGSSSLLYNEFIVYDIAQVKIKYLVKLNFMYKSWF